MTLLVGMYHKDRVYIAADRALTFIGNDGHRRRHSTAPKIINYGEGVVAGTGRLELYEHGFNLAKTSKLSKGRDISHCLANSLAEFSNSKICAPDDLVKTGWYFSAPAAHFIANGQGVVFGLYSKRLNETPLRYTTVPTFELTGMSLASDEKRVELHRKYKKLILAERFDSNIKTHIKALFAEASTMTDDVTKECDIMVHCPKHGVYLL